MLWFSLDVVSLSGDELRDLLYLVAQQPLVPLCVDNYTLQAKILPFRSQPAHVQCP